MAKIHMILQGKGGVGKSFIATVLAQYKLKKGFTPLCIDTDPVNSTFHGFKALNVTHLKIMENDEINTRNFDQLIELIASTEHDVIIDNGASSFVPLSHYLVTNSVAELISELGHELIIHTVITGSQALLDTIHGFTQLVSSFNDKNTTFVVWLNPYWGAIERDGKKFEEMKPYVANKSRIAALIPIPEWKEDTFGVDIADVLKQKLTFDEALAKPELTIMTRQRLKLISKTLDSILDSAIVI